MGVCILWILSNYPPATTLVSFYLCVPICVLVYVSDCLRKKSKTLLIRNWCNLVEIWRSSDKNNFAQFFETRCIITSSIHHNAHFYQVFLRYILPSFFEIRCILVTFDDQEVLLLQRNRATHYVSWNMSPANPDHASFRGALSTETSDLI